MPATCGVAIEVPLRMAKPPPGTEEWIEPPGARKLTKLAELLKNETASLLSVLPTAKALEMQPGALTALTAPSLPAAIAVAMPAERKASIAAFMVTLSSSQDC